MTVASVFVMTVSPLLLVAFTALPFWLCFLIGVPGGLILFWSILFTLFWCRRRALPMKKKYDHVANNLSPEPTAVGAGCFAQESQVREVTVRLRLSFFR